MFVILASCAYVESVKIFMQRSINPLGSCITYNCDFFDSENEYQIQCEIKWRSSQGQYDTDTLYLKETTTDGVYDEVSETGEATGKTVNWDNLDSVIKITTKKQDSVEQSTCGISTLRPSIAQLNILRKYCQDPGMKPINQNACGK